MRKAWGRGWIGNEDRREDRGQGHLQGVAKMEGVKAENERGQGEDGTEKTEVVGRLGILSLSSYSLLFCLQQVMLVAQLPLSLVCAKAPQEHMVRKASLPFWSRAVAQGYGDLVFNDSGRKTSSYKVST